MIACKDCGTHPSPLPFLLPSPLELPMVSSQAEALKYTDYFDSSGLEETAKFIQLPPITINDVDSICFSDTDSCSEPDALIKNDYPLQSLTTSPSSSEHQHDANAPDSDEMEGRDMDSGSDDFLCTEEATAINLPTLNGDDDDQNLPMEEYYFKTMGTQEDVKAPTYRLPPSMTIRVSVPLPFKKPLPLPPSTNFPAVSASPPTTIPVLPTISDSLPPPDHEQV